MDSGPDTDTDTDTDSDTDTDTDTDSDTDTDTGSFADAYFLLDYMQIGDSTEGCDLDGDSQVDNQLGGLATWLYNQGYIDEDPNVAMSDGLASGDILVAMGLFDVESFTDDADVTLSVFEAALDAPDAGGDDGGVDDAGVPPELFSGHGTVWVVEPPHTNIDGTSIVDSFLLTPTADFSVTIPLGDSPTTMTLQDGRMLGEITQAPDTQMLNGKIESGLICGSVDRVLLQDILSIELELDPVQQAALNTTLLAIADIDCGPFGVCQEVSVGLIFTAISVQRQNP